MIKNPNPNVGQEFLDLHMSRLLKVFLCFRSAAYEPALVAQWDVLTAVTSLVFVFINVNPL